MGGDTETGQEAEEGEAQGAGVRTPGNPGEEEVETGGELGSGEQAAPQGWDQGRVSQAATGGSLAAPGQSAGKRPSPGE